MEDMYKVITVTDVLGNHGIRIPKKLLKEIFTI